MRRRHDQPAGSLPVAGSRARMSGRPAAGPQRRPAAGELPPPYGLPPLTPSSSEGVPCCPEQDGNRRARIHLFWEARSE
jgi:hypothetical protein